MRDRERCGKKELSEAKKIAQKKAHWSSELNKMNKYCVFVLLSWKHDIPLVIKGASANFIYAINFVRVCLPSVKWKNLQWESVCRTDIELTEHQERYITNQDDREYNGTRMLCVVMIWSGHAPVKFVYMMYATFVIFSALVFFKPTLSPMCFSSVRNDIFFRFASVVTKLWCEDCLQRIFDRVIDNTLHMRFDSGEFKT